MSDFYRKLGPVTMRICSHDVWLGCGRWLIGLRDHRQIRPLFSERYRKTHTKGLGTRHYVHIGPWCLFLDTDWMNRRRKATV